MAPVAHGDGVWIHQGGTALDALDSGFVQKSRVDAIEPQDFPVLVLEQAPPIEAAALQGGASELLKMNAIYPFSNGGAWVTNVVCCLFIVKRNGTGSQFVRLPGEHGSSKLGFYYLMALLSGAFWYFQFFFYGMGHAFMGETYGFTSWVLHMAMLILFSNLYGWLFREWEGSGTRPRRVLHTGMAMIVVATMVITLGNYLGESLNSGH